MKRKTVLTLLIAFMLVFIWGNSLLSREISGSISDTLMEWMNTAAEKLGLGDDFFTFMTDTDGDGELEASSHLIRKAAHVTEFAVLASLLYLRQELSGKKSIWLPLLLSAAVGGADECLQILSHRGSQLKDVGIDVCGALLGLAVTVLILKRIHKKKTA